MAFSKSVWLIPPALSSINIFLLLVSLSSMVIVIFNLSAFSSFLLSIKDCKELSIYSDNAPPKLYEWFFNVLYIDISGEISIFNMLLMFSNKMHPYIDNLTIILHKFN